MESTRKNLAIAQLISRQLTGHITAAEMLELQAWRNEDPDHEALWQQLTDPDQLGDRVAQLEQSNNQTAFAQLMQRIHAEEVPAAFQQEETGQAASHQTTTFIKPWLRYAAVAIPLLAVASAGWYFLRVPRAGMKAPVVAWQRSAPPPSPNTVQLLIDHQEAIPLNKTGGQMIHAMEGTIARTEAGSLSYPVNTNSSTSAAVIQQLVTPKGMDYKVVLPDGSHVWVGAASSLRFPAAFTGKERSVELNGEAYFEVASDAAHPFVVHTRKTAIQVLGTSFNIKAYSSERYERTTLVSGAVKVSTRNNSISKVLQPGQQAVTGTELVMQTADIDAVLAWKNGLFIFRSEPLSGILDELARWYNVIIVHEEGVDLNAHFTGRIIRSKQLSEILAFLETTGKVRFLQEGQLLRVLPGRK
ncbi:FecR family protein [Chitinophaga sp.]|uniref:FecR family protein n=1 Tax=Chitinophaga sp. TaxID=1869181 RepID=UPI002F9366F7